MSDLVEYLQDCKGIAWDTCHKIYILMDDNQMSAMAGYGYDPLIYADQVSVKELLSRIEDWYANSCSLRFISAVKTVQGDPNEGFTDIISQGEEWEDEELCEECGIPQWIHDESEGEDA